MRSTVWAVRAAVAMAALAGATQAMADVTLFQDSGYRGKVYIVNRAMPDFRRTGFNDKVSSVSVRGRAWEFCEDANFSGRCVVLKPGRYASLREMGLNDKVSSTRPARRERR